MWMFNCLILVAHKIILVNLLVIRIRNIIKNIVDYFYFEY
jgi:hypothetical protein